MDRRDFIRVLGGGVIAAMGTPLTAWGQTGSAQPNSPWSQAPGEAGSDLRQTALSFAILSPNPHNRQPWLVDLATPDVVMLYCDPDRLLPQTDPFSRQIVIGLGAFVETFIITAKHFGRDVSVQLFPEGFPSDRIDGRPIARLALVKGATSLDPLFHQILKRRSVKTPYDMQRPVPDAAITALQAEMRSVSVAFALETEPTRLTHLREVMLKSGLIEVNTPRTWRESVDLMRIGGAENLANPDGISIMGPHIDRLVAAGQISHAMMADTSSPGFRAATERYSASIHGTPAVVWYATANNTREDQIAAGRLWMRLSLTATQFGLGMQPMSQALQEFEEMREVSKDLHSFLGVEQPNRVQMLARLGYGPDVAPTPRWAASTRIRKT